MTDQKIIRVGIVANDENGNPTGRAEVFEFDDLIYLSGCGDSVCFYRIGQDKVKVCRRTFKIVGYGTWVGSMTWDGMGMEIGEAQRLAEYLRSLNKFMPESGDSFVWGAWDNNELINFDVPEPEPEIVVQLSIRPRGEE